MPMSSAVITEWSWMYGDAPLHGHLNPLRWSSTSHHTRVVQELAVIHKQEGHRPIFLTQGSPSEYIRFSTVGEAIAHIHSCHGTGTAVIGETIVREVVVEEELDLNYEICVVTGKRQPYRPVPGNSCEWMYGDAASGLLGFQVMAGLNPLRWSGELTFNRAITHLRKVHNRPIILKVPANTLGQELQFNNTQDAIDHLMHLHRTLIGVVTTYSPRVTGKHATGAALWVEEEIDVNYEICVVTGKRQTYRPGPGNSCEWMYGDAASGLLGFQVMAGLNPLRWSGEVTFNRAITHLRKVQNRPIILKVPANTLGQELQFKNTQDAIDHLMHLHRVLIGVATTTITDIKIVEVDIIGGRPQSIPGRRQTLLETVEIVDACDVSVSKCPKLNVCEKIVEVPFVHEHAIKVEVPEKTYIKNIRQIPVGQVREVETLVEVPEIRHREELVIREEWIQEEITVPVHRTVVKEAIAPMPVTTVEVEEDIVEVEVKIPPGEIVIEKPRVIVEEKIDYIKARDCIVEVSEEIVDVPHWVQVPRVVAVPKVEHRCVRKEVVVPNVNVTANIIEVPEEIIERTCIDVEQIATTRNIRYVPSFKAKDGSCAFRTVGGDTALRLAETKAIIAAMEKEKMELRNVLDLTLVELSEKKSQLEQEKLINMTWEDKIKVSLELTETITRVDRGMTVVTKEVDVMQVGGKSTVYSAPVKQIGGTNTVYSTPSTVYSSPVKRL